MEGSRQDQQVLNRALMDEVEKHVQIQKRGGLYRAVHPKVDNESRTEDVFTTAPTKSKLLTCDFNIINKVSDL